jgi:hypothetical protein
VARARITIRQTADFSGKARSVDHTEPKTRRDGRGAVGDLQLLVDVLEVGLHGGAAEGQPLRDLPDRQSLRGELQNLELSGGQSRGAELSTAPREELADLVPDARQRPYEPFRQRRLVVREELEYGKHLFGMERRKRNRAPQPDVHYEPGEVVPSPSGGLRSDPSG